MKSAPILNHIVMPQQRTVIFVGVGLADNPSM